MPTYIANLHTLEPGGTRAETLGKLHAVRPEAVGLSSYGNPANFSARQAARWHKQYLLSTGPQTGIKRQDSMLQLAVWLQAHAPEHDRQLTAPTIVHGDYRLDNLVMSPDGTAVRAVLDWELSTLGDPLSDVAYVCMVRLHAYCLSSIRRILIIK